MKRDEFIEELLNSFAKIYAFLRAHQPRPYPVVKEIGDLKVGDEKPLDLWHFSTLSLIFLLTNRGERSCRQAELRKIFLYKFPNGKSRFNSKEGVMNVLEAVGCIERTREREGGLSAHADNRHNAVRITDKGIELLGKLREARREDAQIITSQLRVTNEDEYAKIAKSLNNLADNLWKVILTAASKAPDPS